jgi:hypothetical protein
MKNSMPNTKENVTGSYPRYKGILIAIVQRKFV